MHEDFSDADLISAFTRADALREGTRVNIPVARRYGVKIPLDLTEALNRVVADVSGFGQSRTGRLHDLLTMFKIAALRNRDTNRFEFDVVMITREAPDCNHPEALHRLLAVVDADDEGEPVILIGYPDDF